jgi:hypothetical protein
MRSIALGFLRIAVVLEFGWILIERFRFHTSWGQLLYPTLVSVGFGVLAVAPERLRWLPAPLRIFIGVAFTGAICDRLGLRRTWDAWSVMGEFQEFCGLHGAGEFVSPCRPDPELGSN